MQSRIEQFGAELVGSITDWWKVPREDKKVLEAYFLDGADRRDEITGDTAHDLLRFSTVARVKMLNPTSKKNQQARARALELTSEEGKVPGITRDILCTDNSHLLNIIDYAKMDARRALDPDLKRSIHGIIKRTVALTEEIQFSHLMAILDMDTISRTVIGEGAGLTECEYNDLADIFETKKDTLNENEKDIVILYIMMDRRLAVTGCILRNRSLTSLQNGADRLETRMTREGYISQEGPYMSGLLLGDRGSWSDVDDAIGRIRKTPRVYPNLWKLVK